MTEPARLSRRHPVERGLRHLGRAKASAYTAVARHMFESFGRDSVIIPPFSVSGADNISISSDVYLGPGCRFVMLGPTTELPKLVIGSGVSVSGALFISAASRIEIEAEALLARNVYISDHIHAYRDTSLPVRAQGIAKVRPVRIGAGSWIGEHAVITPGVTVGRGAVVAAGAVVVHDVPDFSLVAGLPAAVIRRWGPGAPTRPQNGPEEL